MQTLHATSMVMDKKIYGVSGDNVAATISPLSRTGNRQNTMG